MIQIHINDLQAKIELPLTEAKQLLIKNSKCKSLVKGERAILIYPLKEIQTLKSLLNYDRHPHR